MNGLQKGTANGLLIVLGVLCTVASAAEESPEKSWPQFRGPYGNGHAAPDAKDLPLTWSETENVGWKLALPYEGHSSPVIMDNLLWLTAAMPDGSESHVLCVNLDRRQLVRDRLLFRNENPEPLGNNVNGYASPTPVLEGDRVYVHFGTYGTACLKAGNGDVVWERRDLPCRHYRGPGSSPILYGDLLYLTFDGVDQQYVTALNKHTGETVWTTPRSTHYDDLDDQGLPKREGDFRKAYTTPTVIETPTGPQLISPGSMAAFAYDPASGAELWTVRMGGYTPAIRPIYGEGMVYLANGRGGAVFMAIRPDGKGDVTDTHIAWRIEGGQVPQEPSPILVDGLVYLVSNSGTATCIEAASGAVVWSERLGGNYVASPLYAEGRLYFFNTQGKTTVLKPGRTLDILATNQLDDGPMASPAAVGRTIYLRSKSHLYALQTGHTLSP